MRTVAPAIAALGPLHGVRRRRLAVSGPLGVTLGLSAAPWGPSKPAGVSQGTPPKSEKVPVNAVSQHRWLRPVRRTGVRS